MIPRRVLPYGSSRICQPPSGGVIIVAAGVGESGWRAERPDVMSSYITATVKGAE